jgi:hypothetical protein
MHEKNRWIGGRRWLRRAAGTLRAPIDKPPILSGC